MKMAAEELGTMGFEFFTKSEEIALEIGVALLKVKCCIWCVIRFMGENRPFMFSTETVEKFKKLLDSNSSLNNSKLLEDDPTNPNGLLENKNIVCPSCLGVMQNFNQEKFLEKICEAVEKENHQFSDYQCSLITPSCGILRQHSIYLFLQERFPSVYTKIPEDEIASVKDIWKWNCGPALSRKLNSEFKQKSVFEIYLDFQYANSDKECSFLTTTNPNDFQWRKKSTYELFTRMAVEKVVLKMPDEVFKRHFQTPCIPPEKEVTCDISCCYDAIFIAGRYLKFSRTLSQTPWMIDGVRKTESSVEEEIFKGMSAFKATDFKFSSSGREDVDVRMLGNGRPFIMEVINAHVYKAVYDLPAIQKEINSRSSQVQVRDLQLIEREEIHNLKEGELEKRKRYLAVCWSSEPLSEENISKVNSMTEFEIQQKTPLRVLHRRSQAVRPRMIYDIMVRETNGNYFKLYICTQAGTYIKEFVHGDFGRTSPSLSSIVEMDCDILTLDVEGVELDWPPKLKVPGEDEEVEMMSQ